MLFQKEVTQTKIAILAFCFTTLHAFKNPYLANAFLKTAIAYITPTICDMLHWLPALRWISYTIASVSFGSAAVRVLPTLLLFVIKSYLLHRSFYVKMENSVLSVFQLIYGVPQRSILGIQGAQQYV